MSRLFERFGKFKRLEQVIVERQLDTCHKYCFSKMPPIPASIVSQRTSNPIRAIVDNLKVEPNKDKQMISLALGDPTLFGNFKAPQSCVDEVVKQVQSFKSNGYPPSAGYEFSRDAVARKYTVPSSPLTAKDVIIASGCSGALDLCVTVLANEGQNILLPRPGFSLYRTLCDSKGIEVRYYDLVPEKQWECDLDHMGSLIDHNTTVILINNPSNPCGSVYSEKHLLEILLLAEKHGLPIIADEIYADMAFKPYKFIPLASLSKKVPILTVGGIAKQYLVPGWRVGWILIHDRDGLFSEVRKGLNALSQLILGSNSLIQSILPNLLHDTSKEFYADTLKQLEDHAALCRDRVSVIPGLTGIVPQGAMYMMVIIFWNQLIITDVLSNFIVCIDWN